MSLNDVRLDGTLDAHTTRADASGANRDGREREAKEVFDTTLLLRDQALSVFRTIVAGDHDLSAEVESAMGTADSPDNLAEAPEIGTLGDAATADKPAPAGAPATGHPAHAPDPKGGQSSEDS